MVLYSKQLEEVLQTLIKCKRLISRLRYYVPKKEGKFPTSSQSSTFYK